MPIYSLNQTIVGKIDGIHLFLTKFKSTEGN